MEFTAENLIGFFETKLQEAEKIDPVEDEMKLMRWWNLCKTCCKKMGRAYEERTENVSFVSRVYSYRTVSPEEIERRRTDARTRGFNEAKNVIIDTINDLSTFGYIGTQYDHANNKHEDTSNMIIQNNIMQSQSQSMKIDLSAYDPEVQECINELIAELRTDKDKNKIKKLLSRLTDISVDVLVAIFLHTIGL